MSTTPRKPPLDDKGIQEGWERLLKLLRWLPDQQITNHYGEHVWLKILMNEKNERVGITECCKTDNPCGRHCDG